MATTMRTGAAMAGAALVAGAFFVPGASADARTGQIDGVTFAAPTCTPDGDVVIRVNYPGGLPAGTTVQTNAPRFKFNPGTGAQGDLGATSGTVTFTKSELAIEAGNSAVTSFGLSSTDGRVAQGPVFSTMMCGGGPASERTALAPTFSVGTPVCSGSDVVLPVAVAQPGSTSQELSLLTQDNSLTFSSGLSAPAGMTRAYSVVVGPGAGAASITPGSHTVWVARPGTESPTALTLDIPSCAAPSAPKITITGPTWDCDTQTPSFTYRNETGEARELEVSQRGTSMAMTINVPAGTTTSAAAPHMSGTFDFRDVTTHSLLASFTLDAAAACSSSTPTAPTSSPSGSSSSSPSSSTSTSPSTSSSSTSSPSNPTSPTTASPTGSSSSSATVAPTGSTSTSSTSTSSTSPSASSASSSTAATPTSSGAPTASTTAGPKVDTDGPVRPSNPWGVAAVALLVVAGLGALARRVSRG